MVPKTVESTIATARQKTQEQGQTCHQWDCRQEQQQRPQRPETPPRHVPPLRAPSPHALALSALTRRGRTRSRAPLRRGRAPTAHSNSHSTASTAPRSQQLLAVRLSTYGPTKFLRCVRRTPRRKSRRAPCRSRRLRVRTPLASRRHALRGRWSSLHWYTRKTGFW
jgi:hypothetical protein